MSNSCITLDPQQSPLKLADFASCAALTMLDIKIAGRAMFRLSNISAAPITVTPANPEVGIISAAPTSATPSNAEIIIISDGACSATQSNVGIIISSAGLCSATQSNAGDVIISPGQVTA